jgi:hypothetical protein
MTRAGLRLYRRLGSGLALECFSSSSSLYACLPLKVKVQGSPLNVAPGRVKLLRRSLPRRKACRRLRPQGKWGVERGSGEVCGPAPFVRLDTKYYVNGEAPGDR